MTGQKIEGISGSDRETVNPLQNIEIDNAVKKEGGSEPLLEEQGLKVELSNHVIEGDFTEVNNTVKQVPENYNQGGSGPIRQVWNEKNGDTPPSSGY